MAGAGRADVGHGADVGDLVDGAHQLEVGDHGLLSNCCGKIGDNNIQMDKLSANLNLLNCAKYTKYSIQYQTALIWMELDRLTLATGPTLQTWLMLPTNCRLVVKVTSNWLLVI